MSELQSIDLYKLVDDIKAWANALGFQQVGISDIDLSQHEAALQSWLDNQYHGDMAFMANHGMKRARPAELVPAGDFGTHGLSPSRRLVCQTPE